jgi:hypothetical protein
MKELQEMQSLIEGMDEWMPKSTIETETIEQAEDLQQLLNLQTRKPFEGLSEADMVDLSNATREVYRLMIDGEWHKADEIIWVSGIREGLRRMRELREWFTIEKRNAGSRNFEYRITNRLGRMQ